MHKRMQSWNATHIGNGNYRQKTHNDNTPIRTQWNCNKIKIW